MPELQLERWDEATQPTAAHFRTKLEQMGYQISQYTYPPGTVFPPHTHEVDKVDVVLSGRFRMTMYGETVTLEAGDSLAVPKGALHSAEVVGEEPVVSLDAVRIA
jgi:quercetin dioxygenase-like cupin family protein